MPRTPRAWISPCLKAGRKNAGKSLLPDPRCNSHPLRSVPIFRYPSRFRLPRWPIPMPSNLHLRQLPWKNSRRSRVLPYSDRQASRLSRMPSWSSESVRQSWSASILKKCRSLRESAGKQRRPHARQKSCCSRPRPRCSARQTLPRPRLRLTALQRKPRLQRQRPRRTMTTRESQMRIWPPTMRRKRPRDPMWTMCPGWPA